VGFLVAAVDRGADSVAYTEHTSIAVAGVDQTATVILDAATLDVRRVDQVSSMMGLKPETHLIYGGGRVKGHASAPQPDRTLKAMDIDTTLAAGRSTTRPEPDPPRPAARGGEDDRSQCVHGERRHDEGAHRQGGSTR